MNYKKKSLNAKIKKTYKRKAPTKIAKQIKTIVKREIHRNVENKCINTFFSRSLYGIAGGTGNYLPSNIVCLTPNISTYAQYTIIQGTGQQQRIGNEIRTVKSLYKYTLFPHPYNAATNTPIRPQIVVMWIFSLKAGIAQISLSNAYDVLNNSFFQNGNSDAGLLGNSWDLISAINKDVVDLHYRKEYKIGYESYTSVTSGGDSNQTLASNDFKLFIRGQVDCTKYLPKRIKFNDTDNQSTTRQVFIAWESIPFNGSTNSSAQQPVGIFNSLDLIYEDA